MELAPGTVLGGRYEVLGILGEGANGVVARVRDDAGRELALKWSYEPDTPRFRRELDLVRQLEHPNVVALVDVGTHAGRPFLVFELAAGETLERMIERGPMTLPAVRQLAVDVLRALEAAHAKGIIHRDIKPANIMIDSGRARLLDFGAARSLDPNQVDLTAPGGAVGTPRYMSPEQVASMPVDASTDLYALGLVMAEAISGTPVYDGVLVRVLARHASAEATPLARDVIDSELGAIIVRATRKSPAARFRTARSMRKALDPAAVGRTSRTVAVLALVAAAAAAVLAGAVEVSRPKHTIADLVAPTEQAKPDETPDVTDEQFRLFDRVRGHLHRDHWRLIDDIVVTHEPPHDGVIAAARGHESITVVFFWGREPPPAPQNFEHARRRVGRWVVEFRYLGAAPVERFADALVAE